MDRQWQNLRMVEAPEFNWVVSGVGVVEVYRELRSDKNMLSPDVATFLSNNPLSAW